MAKRSSSSSRREFLAKSALVLSAFGGARVFAQSDSKEKLAPGKAGKNGAKLLIDPRRETSLLNDDGLLQTAIPASQYEGWVAELGQLASDPKAEPRRVALLELWAGEYELAAQEEPGKAAERFLRARKLTKPSDPLFGWSVYNTALAFWYDSRWEEAALAFHEALRGHGGRLCGFDRRLAALWLKQSKAHYAEFEALGKLGVPRPSSLDRHCGAASLAVCLEAQGLPHNKESILKNLKVTGRGSSSHEIIEAAKKLGAVAHELIAQSDAALQALPKPLIAYVERDHFVVVESADKEGVTYRCNETKDGKSSKSWGEGLVSVTWAQWKAMTPGYYVCISRPGSVEDKVLTLALDKPEELKKGVRIASTKAGLGVSSLYLGMAALFQNPTPPPATRPRGDGNKRCGASQRTPTRHPQANAMYDWVDPVDLSTGEEVYSCPPDLVVYNPEGQPVVWQRMYNSLRGYTAGDQFDDFGTGWSHTYNYYIIDQDMTRPPLGEVWRGTSGKTPVTGAEFPANYLYDSNNDGTPESYPREWQILIGSTTVAGSEDSNGWTVGYDNAANQIIVVAPENASGGTYKIRIRHNSTAVSGTIQVTSINQEYKTNTKKTLVMPDGSGVDFYLPSQGDYCLIGDNSRLQIWHETDGYGHTVGYRVLTEEQLTYSFRYTSPVHDWAWPAFQIMGERYSLTQIEDAFEKSLGLEYVNYGSYTAPKNRFPRLKRIKDTNNNILLQINHRNGFNSIYSVEDIYGRVVTYDGDFYPTINPNYGFDLNHWELTSVSFINSTSSRFFYYYGYVETGEMGVNSAGNPAPQKNAVLTSVLEPRYSQSTNSVQMTEVAQINYEDNTMFVSSVIDVYGNIHTYSEVDVNGNPVNMGAYLKTAIISPTGAVIYNHTVAHSGNRVPLIEKDGGGVVVNTKTYNSPNTAFAPSSVADAMGRTALYTYDEYGNTLTETTPRGTTTTYTITYSSLTRGRITQVQQGLKTPTSYEYFEPSGLLKKKTSPSPTGSGIVITTYTYNSLGDPLLITGPGIGTAVKTLSYNYTADGTYSQPERKGQPIVITDTLGNSVRLRYDDQGRVVTAWDPNGHETNYEYNDYGQVTKLILPGGGNRDYVIYDYLFEGGPVSQETIYSYDINALQYAAGKSVHFEYGLRNEVLKATGNTEEHVSYTYDGMNRLSEVTDGRGNVLSSSIFNARGLPSKVTELNTATNNPVVRDYVYNLAGQLTEQSEYYFLSGPVGNNQSTYIKTQFTYNPTDGLLTQKVYPQSPTNNIYFTYDAYGRVSQLSDASLVATIQYTYNDLDLLQSETTTYKGLTSTSAPVPAKTISRNYNANGTLQSLNTPVGTFFYQYDLRGRLSQMTNPFNEVTSWEYTDNDLISKQVLANGIRSFYDFSGRSELLALENRLDDNVNTQSGLLSRFSTAITGFDGAGNRLGVVTDIPAVPSYSGTTQWTYDNRGRLINETSNRLGGWSGNFVYDNSGNLTSFKGLSRTYDKQNQLLSGAGLTAWNGTPNFAYDPQGNPRKYDARMVSFTPYGGVTGFSKQQTSSVVPLVLFTGVRGDMLRAFKHPYLLSPSGLTSTPGVRRYFLYVGTVPIIEMDVTGATLAVNTFGANGLVSRRTISGNSGASVFYTFDERGSTVQRFDAQGVLLSTRATDAYGATTGTASTGDPFDGFGAQWGYYTDTETNYVLCTYRYYDPKVGRWISRDPIGYDGGINLYAYCSGNPVNKIDIVGHKPLNIFGDNGNLGVLGIPFYPFYSEVGKDGATYLNNPSKSRAIHELIFADNFVFWGHGVPYTGEIWINEKQFLGLCALKFIAKERKRLNIPKMKHARLYSCYSTTNKDMVNAWLQFSEQVEGVPEQTGYTDRIPMLTPRETITKPMSRNADFKSLPMF